MGPQGSKVVRDALLSIDAETQAGGVVLQLTRFARQLGLDNPYISQFVDTAQTPVKNFLHMTSWPKELLDRRRAFDPVKNDAVVRLAIQQKRPVRWSDAYQTANEAGRAMLDLGKEFGYNDGYIVPLESMSGGYGGISYTANEANLTEDQIRAVEVVSLNAYHKLEGLLGYFPFREVALLSKREAQITMLIAQGRTDAEIAEILDIKPDTVAKTIKNARRKLGANNRTHLVYLAAQKNQFFI